MQDVDVYQAFFGEPGDSTILLKEALWSTQRTMDGRSLILYSSQSGKPASLYSTVHQRTAPNPGQELKDP